MQSIASDKFELRKSCGDLIGQIRIKFNRHHVLSAFQKEFGQGTFARTDFGDYRFIFSASRYRDTPKNGLIGEEMLA